MTVILVCNTIRDARILPAEWASVALPYKKCSDDFLSKSLIALIATVDSAQVGLVSVARMGAMDQTLVLS
jgi:hypothetical protein